MALITWTDPVAVSIPLPTVEALLCWWIVGALMMLSELLHDCIHDADTIRHEYVDGPGISHPLATIFTWLFVPACAPIYYIARCYNR